MAIFERDGVQLWYEVRGEGAPVLLIHGLGSSGLDWEHQIPALQGFQVINTDLRGHGRSSRGAVPISMELFAQDLAALLDHLGVESAHVVGLSLGGGVAFQIGLDRPALTRSLTIVNSGPHAITNPLAAALLVGSRLLIIRWLGLPKLGEKVAKRLFPKPENAAQRATFVERFRGNDVDCYRRSLKALIGWSALEEVLLEAPAQHAVGGRARLAARAADGKARAFQRGAGGVPAPRLSTRSHHIERSHHGGEER